MSDNESMLSTIDNPYDPFVQFDQWFAFDEQMDYHSCAYLARITVTSEDLSEEEQNEDIERAIDEIVAMNLNGKYIKVEKGKFVANRKILSTE